jgi:hypothetical protein
MFNSDIINFVLNIDFENKINKTKTYYSKIVKILFSVLYKFINKLEKNEK